MKLVGAAFLARFGGRFVNTHPALLPVVPRRCTAPRDALALRRQGHRRDACSSSTPASTPARSSPSARCRCADDDDEASAARTHQGRRARDARRRRRPDGPRRLHRHRQEGHASRERPTAAPDHGAPWSRVYDKTGLEELARGLHEAGVALVSTGVDGRAGSPPPASRSPRSRSSPASPSASTAGSRRCTRRCTPASSPTAASPTHVRAARRARHRAVRPRRRQPLPVRARRSPSGATPGRVRRADRHRRPVDGARRGQEPPVSVAVVTRPGALRRRAGRRRAPAASPSTQRQRLAAEAFAHTATYDVAVASWMGSVLADTADGTGFPAWTGATWERGGGAALRREPAPARRRSTAHWRAPGSPHAEQLHGKEMSYNNYVDTDAARRAAYDFAEPARRDHQARQPVRHRGRRRRRRGAPQGARLRPGLGVRRRHRDQPAGHRRDGRAGRRGLHRGRRRARRSSDDAVEVLRAQEEHPAAAAAAGTARRDAGRVPPDQRRRADADRATGRRRRPTAAATTRRRGRSSTGEPADDADAGRPRVRLAGVPRGEVQRDPAGRTTARRSASAWARSTGSTPAGSRSRAPAGAGARARWRPPTRSSRSPTGCRCCSTPACARSSQPGGSVRDEEVVEAAAAPPASRCTSPAPGTSPTDAGRAPRGRDAAAAGAAAFVGGAVMSAAVPDERRAEPPASGPAGRRAVELRLGSRAALAGSCSVAPGVPCRVGAPAGRAAGRPSCAGGSASAASAAGAFVVRPDLRRAAGRGGPLHHRGRRRPDRQRPRRGQARARTGRQGAGDTGAGRVGGPGLRRRRRRRERPRRAGRRPTSVVVPALVAALRRGADDGAAGDQRPGRRRDRQRDGDDLAELHPGHLLPGAGRAAAGRSRGRCAARRPCTCRGGPGWAGCAASRVIFMAAVVVRYLGVLLFSRS